jgi:hypothetical protein
VCFARIWKKRRSFPCTLSTSFCNRYGVFAMRYDLNLYIYFRLVFVFNEAIPWLRRWVAGLSRGGPDSMPGQYLCYLWLTKWHWYRGFSEYFVFLLSVSFHQCSTLLFICMLHYQDKRVKSGNLPKKQWSFLNRGALDGKVNSFCSVFKGFIKRFRLL